MKKIAISILLIGICMPIFSQVQVGQQVQNTLTFSGRSSSSSDPIYPLIEGPWSVSDLRLRSTRGGSEIRDIRLKQIIDGKLAYSAEYSIKVSGSSSRWTDEPCKVEPTIYKNNYGTSLWKQKCLTIVASTFLQNNNEATRNALLDLSSKSIKHDFNSLKITYTRYGDWDKFAIIRFHVFPSTYGLENPRVGIINTSPWHPSNINSDPDKSKFVEALKNYSELLVTHLDLAYETGSSNSPMPAFQYKIAASVATQEAPKQAVNSNTGVTSKEQKLRDLKKLFDQGLVSQDIYQDQQKKILLE